MTSSTRSPAHSKGFSCGARGAQFGKPAQFVELFRFHLVVLPGRHGARFYHKVWPFYVALLITPFHGDLEKARVMLRGVNPGAGVRIGHPVT